MNQPELVLDMKATLGEGPCWDSKGQVLYWIDCLENHIHQYNPKTRINTTMETGKNIGCIAVAKSGELIGALQDGFYRIDFDKHRMTHLVDPEAHKPNNRFNDGKCDSEGRLWAGTMSMKDSDHDDTIPHGSLYILDPSYQVQKAFGNVTISNGLTWSLDNKVMYYIDTPTKKIAAFDFEARTGQLSNKRYVIEVPEGEGSPDGMCMDSDGMLWVAMWGGYAVNRWNPITGELMEKVHLPVCNVTSCAFGGENLDELYITTSSIGVEGEEKVKQPFAGGLFKTKPGVRGLAMYTFG